MAKRPNRPGNDSGGGTRRWGAALGSMISYWLWRRWRGGTHGAASPGAPVRQQSMERGHEPEGESESIGGILTAAGLLVLGVVVTVVVLKAFFGLLEKRGTPPPAEAEITSAEALVFDRPPKPRLQVDPAIDLQDLHRREYERLYTYGRVDSARLHIPIGRAMQLVARRGLPADSSASDSTSTDSASTDTLRVPTESGFRVMSRRFPGAPRASPFLGSSPEPYTPAPALRRTLTDHGYLPRPDSAR